MILDTHNPQILASIEALGAGLAVPSFARLLCVCTDGPLRAAIVATLARAKGSEASEILWKLEAESDPALRWQVLNALASDPQNQDRLLSQLSDPLLPESDRANYVSSLVGINDPTRRTRAKDSLWNLYETQPALKEAILPKLLEQGDSRAGSVLIQQLLHGHVDEQFMPYFQRMDIRLLRENAYAIQLAASDPKISIHARTQLCHALNRVDPPGALQTYFSGFFSLPENDRANTMHQVFFLGTEPDRRDMLRRIAAQDASKQVRQAAEQYLMGIP